MRTTNLRLNLGYQAAPFLLGSPVDVSSMTYSYQGAPFVVANQQKGARYEYDSRGRLTKIFYTDGRKTEISYDSLGNRQTVTTI